MLPAETQRSLQSAEVERANAGYARTSQVGRAGSSDSALDRVSLSNLSRHIQAALEQSPERLERLERLALEFEAGRYQVDAGKVATRIVDDMLLPGI